jgi:hypothetical protein
MLMKNFATGLLMVILGVGSALAQSTTESLGSAKAVEEWLAPESPEDGLQTLMPPAAENLGDTDFCDNCFGDLYVCVDCCQPGDGACVDACQAVFRECRRNCII